MTTMKMIGEAAEISTGNVTYYFPTKEDLLAVMVSLLCEYQWRRIEIEADDGLSSVMAVCLELATMAAICEEDEIAKDFFLSAYTSPLCLGIMRQNDAARAKRVFGQYCPGWSEEHFAEAEIIVSGIEYATLFTAGREVPLQTRIAGALNSILITYQVPEELRKDKIHKVLQMDYQNIAKQLLSGFKEYVTMSNEQALSDLLAIELHRAFI